MNEQTATSVINRRAELRDAVFFDGPNVKEKISRYWMLLTLAAIIAASGVLADSEATVIGAMIVAPLRIPILGTMLAVVLADRRNLMRSLALLAGGAAAAVGIGFVLGSLVFDGTDIVNSSQVATWSSAGLIDLIAALAVGAVGSIALVRRDISDTLPGVAIAISLVPPLTVIGITLSSGAYQQALGAFLLFATNVSAIWAVGVVTMALFKIQRLERSDEEVRSGTVNRREAYVIFALSIVIIGAILTQSSWSAARSSRDEATIGDVVSEWAEPSGWEVVGVHTAPDVVTVRLEGPLPAPERGTLRTDLADAGIDPTSVQIDLAPRYTITMEDDTVGEED